MKPHILIFCLFFIGCASNVKSEKNKSKEIIRLAVKGSVLPIMEYFASEPNLSPKLTLLKNKYTERFRSKKKNIPPNKTLTSQVMNVFENYWKSVLTERLDSKTAIITLYTHLNNIAKSTGKDFRSFSKKSGKDLSNYLKVKLKDEGYNTLWGRTAPHMEFMAWKKQTSKVYKVALGKGEIIDVEVELLDDFISYGWLGYATFNELHTGGWATKEKLFCVASNYDLNSESFKLSYLAHEGRHFSDFKKYPQLTGTDLEYRAKLTELILAEKTFFQLLRNFINEAANNKISSHAYASYKLVENLQGKIKSNDLLTIKKDLLKQSAQELLQAHTKKLNSLGPKTIKSVF